MSRTINSANAEYQVLEALRTNRQKRNRENAFIVEGVRNIDAALAHGWVVRSALTVTQSSRSAWCTSVLERVDDVIALPAPLFEALTEREDPPEALLVVEKQTIELDAVPVGDGFAATLLDRPSNPGNIGTIMRTCDALGSQVLLVTGHGADPFDPRAVRASTGSFFAVPIVEVASADALRAWATQRGVTLVATDESGTARVDALPPSPVAYLFGNETAGLSQGLRTAADLTVAIEMRGTASSLNIAAAHAIVLHAATSATKPE